MGLQSASLIFQSQNRFSPIALKNRSLPFPHRSDNGKRLRVSNTIIRITAHQRFIDQGSSPPPSAKTKHQLPIGLLRPVKTGIITPRLLQLLAPHHRKRDSMTAGEIRRARRFRNPNKPGLLVAQPASHEGDIAVRLQNAQGPSNVSGVYHLLRSQNE